MGAPSVSGTNYTWSYTVKSTDDQTYALTATAKDAAGNAGFASTDGVYTVQIDLTDVAGNAVTNQAGVG